MIRALAQDLDLRVSALIGDAAPVQLKHVPPSLPRGFLIVIIDSAYLQRHLFPELTRRHFGPDDAIDYHVRIRSDDRTFYESEPQQPSTAAERVIPLRGIDPMNGMRSAEDALSGMNAWQLAVTPNTLVESPLERFHTTGMLTIGASLLVLGAALVTPFSGHAPRRGPGSHAVGICFRNVT